MYMYLPIVCKMTTANKSVPKMPSFDIVVQARQVFMMPLLLLMVKFSCNICYIYSGKTHRVGKPLFPVLHVCK